MVYKELYNITGMTCSACSTRIEKGMNKMEGVEEVNVNLLKNSMQITYEETLINPDKIMQKIEKMGYNAQIEHTHFESSITGEVNTGAKSPEAAYSQELKQRFLISLVFTLPLFYIAMGEMAGWPLPDFLVGTENAMIFAFTQFLLVLPVLIAGKRYFQVGIRNLLKRNPNMDSLIALGSGAALLYGVYAIYKIAWGLGHGNMEMVHHFSMDLYFESSAMILTLITLGKYFEARAKNRTSEAITKLMNLTPKTAIVIRDGKEQEISIDDVGVGETLVVKEGAFVPVDGVITVGYTSVDESAITGESLPVEKKEKDTVIGGTINKSGYFKMEATAVGENTALAKIIQLVDDATSSKAPIAKMADKISGVFVPVVMLIAIAAVVFWMISGQSFEFALSIGISILVISCPCALGLATPTAIMVGTGRGASEGILIKSAESLEIAHSLDTVVLDKTGTITEGKPAITDMISDDCERLLEIAASLEHLSGHPLAEPILREGEKRNISLLPVEDYKLIPGGGIIGKIGTDTYYAGNQKLMSQFGIDSSKYTQKAAFFAETGKTPLFFASAHQMLGMIVVADVIKESSKGAIKRLHQMGIDVIMLTGDNKKTAEAIGKEVGVKQVISEVLPDEKEMQIRRLQEQGRKVAMVGDGINDSPALVRADVGIAIGAGTDIAMESADIVLMKSDLMDVTSAIRLSHSVMRNIKQNLFWAFFYNVISIPVAAGVFYYGFGILLNPMIAAAAMSFSSVSVVLNALRLRFFTPKWK